MLIKPDYVGWLKELADLRNQDLNELFNLKSSHKNQYLTLSLYDPLHNKGSLFYPTPYPGSNAWSAVDQAKVWSANRLLKVYFASLVTPINKETHDQSIDAAFKSIYRYYINLYPDLNTRWLRIGGVFKPYFFLAELLINKRTSIPLHKSNLGQDFFYKALFYPDSYLFKRWLLSKNTELEIGLLRAIRDDLNNTVIMVIVNACAITTKTDAQLILLELFLTKSNLSYQHKEFAYDLLSRKQSFRNLAYLKDYNFELRYYFLEIAFITFLAKKFIGQQDLIFLEEFAGLLCLDKDICSQLMVSLMEVLPSSSITWQPNS